MVPRFHNAAQVVRIPKLYISQVSGKIIEPFINFYFTAQVILLLYVYPIKFIFFKNYLNWIDLISIFPFYIGLVVEMFEVEDGIDTHHHMGGLRVLRLIRLLRILKLFRHSEEGQSTLQFLYQSIPEFKLLLYMWSIGTLLFGPFLFLIEKGEPGSFNSAFSGMWFCVTSITTVGYGIQVPVTDLGKFVAAMYIIMNLTVMTIPVSIIITKFKSVKKISNTDYDPIYNR